MPTAESPAPTPLRFFEGLAWAVPTAFAGALAAFRFEQGDVLHRDAAAYGGTLAPEATDSIQVLAPPRSARSGPTEADRDRRRTSFESDLTLAVVDLATGERRELETTQGRLLMTLWRGDVAWIEGEGEAPALPLGARELATSLEPARPAFVSDFGSGDAAQGSLFLFVVDLANDASRVKSEAIREALTPLGEARWLDRSPVSLGLDAADAYHPALVVRAAALPGVDEVRVTDALRGALYGGSVSASGAVEAAPDPDESEPTADRFSVARHGLLVPLGSPAPPADG